MSETVLWTNSSPTSTLNIQTVTLSDNISNYERLKFVYYYSTTAIADETKYYIDVDTSNFATMTYNTSDRRPVITLAMVNTNNDIFTRGILYVSDTQVRISTSYKSGATGATNTTVILYQIIGLK